MLYILTKITQFHYAFVYIMDINVLFHNRSINDCYMHYYIEFKNYMSLDICIPSLSNINEFENRKFLLYDKSSKSGIGCHFQLLCGVWNTCTLDKSLQHRNAHFFLLFLPGFSRFTFLSIFLFIQPNSFCIALNSTQDSWLNQTPAVFTEN